MTHQVLPPRKIPGPAFKYPVLSKLVSRLRIPVSAGVPKLKTAAGPEARMMRLRLTVTGLIKYERIELNFNRADLCQGYCERLISDAIRYGPETDDMMEIADYWLLEKQLVHKLFKVLVPRFQSCSTAYTKLYKAPQWYYSDGFRPELNSDPYNRELNEADPRARQVSFRKAVLELKGHPYPPFFPSSVKNPAFLHNVLLSAAKVDHYNRQNPKDSNASLPADDLDDSCEVNELAATEGKLTSTPSLTTQ